VVWRGDEGQLHAVKDLCIHRGTALTLGWTQGDRIVCPYHGWQYRADGICTAIPQLADPTRVPSKARIDAYTCREALGPIWVAMDGPRYELPDIPELADPVWMTVPAGPYRWASDSSRLAPRRRVREVGDPDADAFAIDSDEEADARRRRPEPDAVGDELAGNDRLCPNLSRTARSPPPSPSRPRPPLP
jgi:phenylpropionate dioxygenase-like ring-hydroxylating dioxygenase large terminal subunit